MLVTFSYCTFLRIITCQDSGFISPRAGKILAVCLCSFSEEKKKKTRSRLALFYLFYFTCKELGVSLLSRLIFVKGTAKMEG